MTAGAATADRVAGRRLRLPARAFGRGFGPACRIPIPDSQFPAPQP
ncbi:conserved hypothetical protein [Xanthomonas campestris pv. raphani 756C]|nr:conserved hypothetical protein [Xanthomonas campestris pv. raphani 756C]